MKKNNVLEKVQPKGTQIDVEKPYLETQVLKENPNNTIVHGVREKDNVDWRKDKELVGKDLQVEQIPMEESKTTKFFAQDFDRAQVDDSLNILHHMEGEGRNEKIVAKVLELK